MADLFRQSALDRAASPERLDEAISIVSMRSWLVLVGVASAIAAALIWGWFGSIPTRATGLAIILSDGEALGFISVFEGNRLEPGMTAQVAPRGVNPSEFGAIRAEVETASDWPVTQDHVDTELGHGLADVLFEDGPPIEVHLRLQVDRQSPSGFVWSSGPGPPFEVKTGTLADVTVTISERRPITLIMPALQKLVGS